MSISRRKNDHIRLTRKSQTGREQVDSRFTYEPLLGTHPEELSGKFTFLGKEIGGPLFLSSITGGSAKGYKINKNIAYAAKELNLPMGLGSIRAYLNNPDDKSFNMRKLIGDTTPLFGNIGITQTFELMNINMINKLQGAVTDLDLDGLIIHVNPLQEWLQPEGDNLTVPPLQVLQEVLPKLECKIIIKEVGCGFGPKSLIELMNLPIDVIDFAAFGGTNFSKMELLRSTKATRDLMSPFINIGNTPDDMISNINNLLNMNIGSNKEFIISGGIKNFLDGYYYNSILNAPSIYAYAANILKFAHKSADSLISFLTSEIKSYMFAQNYLDIKK